MVLVMQHIVADTVDYEDLDIVDAASAAVANDALENNAANAELKVAAAAAAGLVGAAQLSWALLALPASAL